MAPLIGSILLLQPDRDAFPRRTGRNHLHRITMDYASPCYRPRRRRLAPCPYKAWHRGPLASRHRDLSTKREEEREPQPRDCRPGWFLRTTPSGLRCEVKKPCLMTQHAIEASRGEIEDGVELKSSSKFGAHVGATLFRGRVSSCCKSPVRHHP